MWVSRKRWKAMENRLWALETSRQVHKERLDGQRKFQDDLQNELMKHSERLATLEGRADTRDVVELPMGDRTALGFGLVPMQVRVPFSTWARLVSRALRIVGSPGQGASAQQLPEPETKKKGAK